LKHKEHEGTTRVISKGPEAEGRSANRKRTALLANPSRGLERTLQLVAERLTRAFVNKINCCTGVENACSGNIAWGIYTTGNCDLFSYSRIFRVVK
jgi:hypothetical protein